MDHDKDDSMDDMLGPVPSSISMGQQGLKLQFPKIGNYSALLENEQNLFEGMISSDGAISQLASAAASKPDQLSLVAATTSNTLPLKRTLPSLYWNNDDAASPLTTKRFQADNPDGSINGRTTDGNASIASLLSQLPQTPSLHQQSMLGSLSDGVFRQTFQLPGMNWYA